ncbi:unnamed protein product [Paramecium sonneborni]|uniref:SAM domain-containing protein n=1 Tax=Paramecium sonneborni TaxID=65129 RepID=A0A8S1LZZ1_9CILI|nr:unnamed protein product [Paramecium sonneborni]
MDYDDLFRLLPKPPKKWTTQEVLVWLKYIGYSQLDTYFVNECVDGSCLEILTDQDLLDIGVQSPLQRKKLLQWIQIGLKEFTNYCKTHIKNEIAPKMVQTFMEVQSISSPRVEIPQQDRLPLKDIQDKILQSRHEYEMEIDEKTTMGQIPIEPLPSPGARQKKQFILPVQKSQSKITEEDLARQVQQSNKKNIFAQLQMQPIQKPIIQSPQKQQLQESDYYLPQFGTPRFDKQEKKDSQEFPQNNQKLQQQQYSIQSPKTLQQQQYQIQSPNTHKNQLNIKIKKEGLPTQKKLITKNATIGRNPENDIQLNHESVSRTHVWLTYKEKQFYLQDRGSLIGTFILLETKTQIMQGYIIQMGATEVIIQTLQVNGQQCNIVLASQMGSVQFTLLNGKSKMIGSQTFGDQTMAYDHALLEFTNEGLSIEDQKTSSGTWMRLSKSGVQSQIVPLSRRRVIKIAEYILIIEPE